ncbi:MAG: VTT domain-containing protein [Deltaproteobacteria bacterium]|nr:VTT domain-containing protein [Deltaproteobacteria bacterium]
MPDRPDYAKPKSEARVRIRVRLALMLVAFGVGAWVYASGTHAATDPAEMRAWLQQAGAWGGVLFISAYCVLQPLGVRSLFFLLTAPLVWEPATAFALSWAGTVAASVAAFAFARFVARGWVQRRLPPGIRQLDDRLALRGLRTVLLLRLLFYTAPTLQFALGVSRVKLGSFLAGTIVGVIPFTLLTTLLGVQLNAWLEANPISTWPWDRFGPLILLTLGAILLVAFHFIRRWQGRLSFEHTGRVDLHLEQEP